MQNSPLDFWSAPAERSGDGAFGCPGRPGTPTPARAHEKKGELVTGDPEFKALEQEIKIDWLK
jgi:hypothetical protein